MNNLNREYSLLNYNISVMKDIIKNMNDTTILDLCPITKYDSYNLLYQPLKINSYKEAVVQIGQTPDIDKDDFPIVKYTNNFLSDYTIIDKKFNSYNILYTTKILKLLDVRKLSVELGFNPLYFNYNNNLYEINEDVIVKYCKTNKLDGYINLNMITKTRDTSTNECFNYIVNYKNKHICPTVYLLNYKTYGVVNLKSIGIINITKNNNYLTQNDIKKLYNVLFCNISEILSTEYDIVIHPKIKDNVLSFTDNQNKQYNFDTIYDDTNIANINYLTVANLNDVCNYNYFEQQNIEIENSFTILPNINDLEIYTEIILNSNDSKKIFSYVLKKIASKYNINQFLYTNVDVISTIVEYSKLFEYITSASNINEIQKIINELEKNIIYNLYIYYQKSKNGYKATLNLINLMYLENSNHHLTVNIINLLENNKDDITTILTGKKSIKKINNYFNTDLFNIDICYNKYNTSKKLYQQLLYDITKYQKIPIINLEYVKYISNLTHADKYNDIKKIILLNIYNNYKRFLNGELIFSELYEILKINDIYNILFEFATEYNFNISLILRYYEFSEQYDNKDYNIQVIKNLTIEEFQDHITNFKKYILITKILDETAAYYNLDSNKENVKSFLSYNIEKNIDNKLNSSTDEISTIISNNQTDFYNIIHNKLNIIPFISELKAYNTNKIMLEYIYNYLDMDITAADETIILKLISNKNLFDIYIQYLKSEISKDNLKTSVLTDMTLKSKKKKQKIDKEKEIREDI
jgi:hypothetical protein